MDNEERDLASLFDLDKGDIRWVVEFTVLESQAEVSVRATSLKRY